MSLFVRNLVKQGFWQDASLANTLLGVIWGKILVIVDPYRYSGDCYAES
jgi:hypothetical protein